MLKAVLFDFDDTLIDVSVSREERALKAYRRLREERVEVTWGAFWYTINSLDRGHFYRRGVEGAIADLGLDGTALGDECIGYWRFTGAEDLIAPSEGCIEMLEVLQVRYRLGIVTNGPESTQRNKFAHSGLSKYFDLFLPSGEVGVLEPDPRILELAMQRLGVKPHEAVFIGDHLDLDVICAQDAGMRGIHYNPGNRRRPHPYIEADATIRHLRELPAVLDRWSKTR